MISAPTLSADPLYMNGLNPPQRQAVETLNGPVLLLAGAGTGKTRALTARLAHLLHTGTATPGQILAVTFTNKAAAEMRHRVSGLLGGIDVAGWHIGTFHSLAARMLRRHAELVGLTSSYTIIDEDDCLRVMKQVFELQGIDAKTINPRMVMALIDRWKNNGLRPTDLQEGALSDSNNPLSGGQLLNLYRGYQERLVSLNACDFGDLLLHLVTIFRDPANGVLAQYHARFKYILVDEYQDTNAVQYQWLRLLAQGHYNICCVGDDDQSIYAWRGADISNILNFEKDFSDATIIRLEQNYRSTPHILNAANGLIAHNTGRLGKNLWTNEAEGDKVTITAAMDQNDEARQIADEIESLQQKRADLDEIAVLVRTSSQMRAFEERFNTVGIPYRVIGGPRFYERMEIRDAIAYLRLINQLNDDLAFERIINTPKRGLGAKTIQDLQVSARAMRQPLFIATEQLVQTDELKPSPRATLTQFVKDVNRWRAAIDTMAPQDLTSMILEESGYIEMWRTDKSIEAAGRLDNLKELINAISGFTTLGAFLEHVALVMENNQASDQPRVTLMTLHAAKGLEYRHVFLPGWEEGLFPSQRSMDENGLQGLEEERRLAYVGITRARNKAHIYYALRRQIYGEYNDTVPSRFMDEIPAAHADDQRKNMQQKWMQQSAQVESATRWGGGRSYSKAAPRVIDAVAVHIPTSSAFKVGQRIFHDKFGYGRVTAINDEKLDIDFEKAGSKKLLENFVRPAEQA
jgi:DNA helicase-2/ATP-dependent DNA helicase PcrA